MSTSREITQVVLRWLETYLRGEPVPPEELCRACPHHLAEVSRRIRALQAVYQVFDSGPSEQPEVTASPSAVTQDPKMTGTWGGARPGVEGYEVLEEQGHGGMGVVYRARHRALDRHVAIKVMRPGAPVERFLREAKLLAKIRSPYVVTVHDFDVLADGCPVLVMEWVEGTDLHKRIRDEDGPLPEARVVPWMRHACEGMLAAAEQGVIHRDLKPSNLLIDSQDRARVADFGLARGPAHWGEQSAVGGMMGTPFYMAPEQAEDPRGVDTRADVYSFGATFYHALTGAPPFDGPTAFSVLYKHKTEPLIPPRYHNPALSDRVGEVLERCLAKNPAERFASFKEVLRLLQPSASVLSPWEDLDDPELAPFLATYRQRRAYYLQEGGEAEPESFAFPNGQTLCILQGDLAVQEVDALVSSDTCFLEMDFGVSRALRRAAGEEVFEQAQKLVPVRAGRAAVTTAGRLPARFLFHGVTIGYDGQKVIRPSRDLIAEILASCFYLADSHDVKSIAFPLLATGGQGFPRDVCLDTMFQFLARTLLRGLTSVCEARIVIFPLENTVG